MLPVQLFRDDVHLVRRALDLRHTEAPVDRVIELDEQRRTVLVELERLRAQRNEAGKAIGKAKDEAERQSLIDGQRTVADRLDELEQQQRTIDAGLRETLSEFPNLVDPATPEGAGEEDNVELRRSGDPVDLGFEAKPHWELGESLSIIDTETAAAMAGSRMYMLKGAGAKLQRALIGYFLETHESNGYTEVYVPVMVREKSMWAAAKLPKFGDTMFHDAEEDHWFVPTAEVPLTLMHMDEILDDSALPLKYAAHSPCFRREKVAHGRDVRGIKRVFQFEKVELYQFTKPEDSPAALEAMLHEAETLLQELELTHRVLQISSGDLGFTATVQYDLEVWAPGAQEWLEVGSTSNCTDFQARRTNTRYRPLDDEGKPGRPQFVHTLNGSGLALPRVLAAILESYQRENGSVAVPDVLQHRMGRLLQITV